MDSNIVHVPTPYNSQFQRETCMHLSSASLPPMYQIFGLDFHDRPHFFANFSTVRCIFDFHSPLQFLLLCNLHYPQTWWCVHTVFLKTIFLIFSYRPTPCEDDSPQQAIARYQRVRFFAGIYHLLTTVVLTKRDILHIFPIRSWKRVWSVCISFKFFSSMAFTSYYWPQPTVFGAVCSEYLEANLRLIWGLAQCHLIPITSSIGKTHPWLRRMLFTRNHLLHQVVPTPRGTQFLRWSQSTWSVWEHDLGGLVW
jgi:hypothetical protein